MFDLSPYVYVYVYVLVPEHRASRVRYHLGTTPLSARRSYTGYKGPNQHIRGPLELALRIDVLLFPIQST